MKKKKKPKQINKQKIINYYEVDGIPLCRQQQQQQKSPNIVQSLSTSLENNTWKKKPRKQLYFFFFSLLEYLFRVLLGAGDTSWTLSPTQKRAHDK